MAVLQQPDLDEIVIAEILGLDRDVDGVEKDVIARPVLAEDPTPPVPPLDEGQNNEVF